MNNTRLGEWGIRAAALGLAILIWFHAVTENTYHKEFDIPVEVGAVLSSSDQGQLVVANEIPSRCRILAAGRGKDLLQLDENAFVLKIQPGEQAHTTATYRVSLSDIENRIANNRVQVQQIVEPKEVQIELDVQIEKEIPIEPEVELRIAEGHTLVGNTSIKPNAIIASGPSKQVQALRVLKTEAIVVENVTHDIERQLLLRPPEGSRLALEPERVTFFADVQILAEDVIEGVPVRIRNRDTTAVIAVPSRARVKVRGGIDIIANLNPDEDLDLSVDYGSYSGSELPIVGASNEYFEIREIFPRAVQLVKR